MMLYFRLTNKDRVVGVGLGALSWLSSIPDVPLENFPVTLAVSPPHPSSYLYYPHNPPTLRAPVP